MSDVREKDICGHCNKKCEEKGKYGDGLLCDYCDYWVHASCEGMSIENYKAFVKLAQDVPTMSYYCTYNHCKTVSTEILKQLGPIRQNVKANTQRIDKLEEVVIKQNNTIEDRVTAEVAKCLGDKIEDQVKTVFEHEKDKAIRAYNVIVSGIPEPSGDNADERKREDMEKIKSILETYIHIDMSEVKVMNVLRLGKNKPPQEGTGKGRLVKIIFQQEYMAMKVLRATAKLSEAEEENIKSIRMYKDMSPSDREKRKKLVEEMKKKNQEIEGSADQSMKWIIRGDILVKVKTPFQ